MSLTTAAATVVALGGCSSSGAAGPAVIVHSSGSSSAYHGDLLEPPQRLTAADQSVSFHTSQGGTSTLRALQRHRLMLVYFGYTHCPDVCPTTMADLGAALRRLPTTVRDRVQVVFITTDPARDTPPVMKAWLANFDGGLSPFVGLTASNHQIDTLAHTLGVLIQPPVKHKNGTVTVQHGAQTQAFIDDAAHLLWTGGTTPQQYATDIARLLARASTT